MRKILPVVMALALALGATACDDDDDITGADDEEFAATLTASPGIETSGTGSATFDFNPSTGVVSYTINVADMTSVTAAHIHGPAAVGANAGVIVGLFEGPEGGTGDVDGQLVAGTFTAADIEAGTGLSLAGLLNLMRTNQTYVNVHTTENTGGEIRGHIVTQ
jgi:hypothetical protein